MQPSPKFQFYEFVRVIADQPHASKALVNKEGLVVGMSDGGRDYAVHFNECRETFAINEQHLESCGRVGSRQDVVGYGLEELLEKMKSEP